jgi:2-dehydro-3-deoxy-L-rhamnonate dehydrogenase (NAD+)
VLAAAQAKPGAHDAEASAYSASKAGVSGFTKSLAKEIAGTDIRVDCGTPAAVSSPIFDQMTQAHIDFMLSKIPVGRFGAVECETAPNIYPTESKSINWL